MNVKQRSRMNNYQTSDPQEHNNNSGGDSPRFEDDDPNQVEILFDPNEALAGFGNPTKQNQQQNYYNDNDDGYEGEKMGSGNSSGFFEHEEAAEQQMTEPKNYYSSAMTPSEVPTTDFEEIDKGFNMRNDDFLMENIPENKPVQNYVPDTVSSYASYQISSAARNAGKRKPPPMKNKLVNQEAGRSNKPEILSMHNDDIGEVGEWVGKSANMYQKNEDSEDDDDEEKDKNDDDDFEGVFDQTEPAGSRANAAANKEKVALRNRNRDEDDEEEEESGQKFQAPENMANFAEQSSRAMQKAQDSALRNARNRGPFANNLKEKAKNLQSKAQEKVMGQNDGDIKLKNEAQKPDVFEEDEEEAEDFDAVNKRFEAEAAMNNRAQQTHKQRPETDQQIAQRQAMQARNSPEKLFETDEAPQGLDDVMDLDNAMNNQSPITKPGIQQPIVDNRQSPARQTPKTDKKQQEISSPAIDEWDVVSKATTQQVNQKAQKSSTKLVTFQEAWDILKSLNLSEQKKQVQQDLQGTQTFFQKIFGSCSGAGLSAPLLEERDHALALAKIPFSEDEPLYFNILETLYIKLTGKNEPVPRFGTHWEIIGFQGRDPATDLRGVGVLGLVQLLAFLSANEKLFKKMFERSIHDKYNFPLSICGFSVTQSVMEVVRAGRLNSNINAKRSVIEAMNEAYFATFFKLYNIYEVNSYTIQDYPKAKMAAIGLLKANPNTVISEYNRYCDMNR